MNEDFTESFSVGRQVKSPEGTVIAFLSSQIGLNCTNLNMSVQVVDRALLELNKDLFKNQYFEFIDRVTMSAINNGWDVLKEVNEEVIEEITE